MGKTIEKADGAFRTIREVADWLGVPTHVLRFWESKFDAVAPVKGSGGRRYYRPDDMRLLGGIKVLLHDQGQTIRGVAQTIEDEGCDGVMALSPAFDLPEPTARRTRRVIRAAGERDGGGSRPPPPPSEVVDPSDAAPNDAVADPVDLDRPAEPGGQPGPAVFDGAPAPDAVPVDEAREVAQPGDPVESESEPELDPETVPEAARKGRASEPPSVVALRLVRGGTLRDGDPRRLRRILRRLRGLTEEIAEDLRG